MKKILVIGSTCVDIILKLDHLPVTGEDLHPKSQSMALGGCACNAAHVLLYSGSEFTFLSPVGGGIYGDLVKEALTAHGFSIPVYLPEKENGCCYCLVEASGERTFLSLHGVEYTFRKEWMEPYRMEDYSMAYLCGLEVEEPTGEALVEYFEKERGPKLFFAPGPRGTRLPGERLNRILALSPVLHINEQEALELGGRDCVADAAAALYQITGSPVIVTLGERRRILPRKRGTRLCGPGNPVKGCGHHRSRRLPYRGHSRRPSERQQPARCHCGCQSGGGRRGQPGGGDPSEGFRFVQESAFDERGIEREYESLTKAEEPRYPAGHRGSSACLW